MVQAELVPPAIHAVQVIIDEYNEDAHPGYSPTTATTTRGSTSNNNRMSPLEIGVGGAAGDGIEGNYYSDNNRRTGHKCIGRISDRINKSVNRKCLLIMVILCITCIILILLTKPTLVIASSGGQIGHEGGYIVEVEPVGAPSPVGSFNGDCYTSTWDMIQAQLDTLHGHFLDGDVHEERNQGDNEGGGYLPHLTLVVCPNTTIHIGKFANPVNANFDIVDGDYPLWFVRPNVTIQCGYGSNAEDGNCVLSGGYTQAWFHAHVPLKQPQSQNSGSVFVIEDPVDNVMVRGMTFTGELGYSNPFTGISVTISHPSNSIQFVDCVWRDMITVWGMIGVYTFVDLLPRNQQQQPQQQQDQYERLPDQSINVTFTSCLFDSITYDGPFILTDSHIVTIEKTIFRNIFVSKYARPTCQGQVVGDDNSDINVVVDNGCAGLLYCGPQSICTFRDVCILEPVEHNGDSLMLMSDLSTYAIDRTYYYNSSYHTTEATSDTTMSDGPAYYRKYATNSCELATIVTSNQSPYEYDLQCEIVMTEPTCRVDNIPYE